MALKNIVSTIADRRRFVLVVDSNERNRKYLTSILKQFEYDVYAIRTAQEATELAATVSPVLIITSRQIDGETDAITFLRSFREANPTCTAPVIVLVAKADAAFERSCLDAGALVCLRAPIAIENFYRVIQVAIEPIPRMNIRISADLPVIIDGARKDASVRVISENGAYVETSHVRPLKTKVPVMIKLTDCVVTADAEVIYSTRSGDGRPGRTGMGLQFVRISEEDQKRIRMFIRSEMSKGVAPLRPAQ